MHRGRYCLECALALCLVLLCTFAILATEMQYVRATLLQPGEGVEQQGWDYEI
jgi:hypothetical protein